MTVRGRCNVMVALIIAGLLGACGGSGESAPAPAKAPAKVEVTEMRGVIEKMPTAEGSRRLMIRHEATKSMGVMTMPFVVAEGVSLTGLAVGDKVGFSYELNLTAGTERVTKIAKLPAETVLKLEAATMPGGMTMPEGMKMPGM